MLQWSECEGGSNRSEDGEHYWSCPEKSAGKVFRRRRVVAGDGGSSSEKRGDDDGGVMEWRWRGSGSGVGGDGGAWGEWGR
ncbi:hypothetical protein Tco_0006253 [Tanacetum coccineum]